MNACWKITLLLLLPAVFLVGCGGGGAPVQVKVVNGDKPYSEATDGKLSLSFVPEDPKGSTFAGGMMPDGTIKLRSSTSDGVTPGKYKVNITRYPATSEGTSAPTPSSTVLPDVIEVTPSTTTVTVDISKAK
jgi:hypothetical protein